MTFSMTIPGNPVPWERCRLASGRFVLAPATRAYERDVATAALVARVELLTGPVRVWARFWRKDGHPCDLDNLAKAVLDALNHIAYEDDRQVVELIAAKAVDPEHPRAEVVVKALQATQQATSGEQPPARTPVLRQLTPNVKRFRTA